MTNFDLFPDFHRLPAFMDGFPMVSFCFPLFGVMGKNAASVSEAPCLAFAAMFPAKPDNKD